MSERKVPKLRFAGFTDDWKQRKLGKFLVGKNEQISENSDFVLMSFTATHGVTPKSDRYNREFLVKDANKKYKKTILGDLIYSSNNLDVGSIGMNKVGNALISPVYSIFATLESASPNFMGIMIQKPSFISKMLRYRQGVTYGQWRIHENEF
ncbi:hypothetical protein [Moraxella equi]|uniref:Type I restriction modification DNA specificity domain n=1 Tax=Moraxella equi TaxID=60442 RepID=A0A378QSD4_9GAMM|nr:hypothetical protein [Moraxella equi]OPH39591.1 hypothetical protein B5J93_03550 [Moraxella equi]STZ02293.1 Uncharacterised protein [Moraxella equi]